MPIYICKKCGYETPKSGDFTRHLKRKNKCDPNNIHKNTKKLVNHHCTKCNYSSYRIDTFNEHMKTVHEGIEIENIPSTPELFKYNYYNIDDLTLFEQYLSLTSQESPYKTLLDNLNLNPSKPKYNNVKYKDLHRNAIDIYSGKKWIKGTVNIVVSQMITSQQLLIKCIFDRFRIFMNKKAINLIEKAYYYGSTQNFYFHKKIIQDVKIHLYNNRKNTSEPNTDIPEDVDDDVWWALSSNFTWDYVEKIIGIMDKKEIDFSKNLDVIKNDIIKLYPKNPKYKKLFSRVIKRINSLINDFNESKAVKLEGKKKKYKTIFNDSDSDDESEQISESDEESNNESDNEGDEKSNNESDDESNDESDNESNDESNDESDNESDNESDDESNEFY